MYAGLCVDNDNKHHSFKIEVTENTEITQTCQNLNGLFNLKAPRQKDGSIGRLVDAYKNQKVFNKVFRK